MKKFSFLLNASFLCLTACANNSGQFGQDGSSCSINKVDSDTAVIICTDGSSFTLHNGQDGDAGSDGKPGTGCSITEKNDNFAVISCTDGSSYTVYNGKDGDAGSDGKPGTGCSITEKNDNFAVISCTDGSSYTIYNGKDGDSSTDSGKLPVGEGVNYCLPGYYGRDCRKCNCVHGTCNDGTNGDGSCQCAEGFAGEICTECSDKRFTGYMCNLCADKMFYGHQCDRQYDSMTDSDGNTYKTAVINNQIWMAENMRLETGNYHHAHGNAANDEIYGLLYDWDTAQTVCPIGWRLPTSDDFNSLLEYATNNNTNGSAFLSLIANSTAWTDYANQGYDEFGFQGLPAGFYEKNIAYTNDNFGDSARWWTSTSVDSNNAYRMYLGENDIRVVFTQKRYGFSVRCIAAE